MSCVPTGRVGLTPEVSGFVVHEDQALSARAMRAASQARVQARGRVHVLCLGVQARVAASGAALRRLLRGAAGGPALAKGACPVVEASAPSTEPPQPAGAGPSRFAKGLRRMRIALAAGLIRGHQLAIIARGRLKPAERGRDMAALAWVLLRWSGRAILRAPRWLQVPALVGLGLWLAPWPETDVPPQAPVLAMTATPVEKPREADLWRPVPGVIAAWHLEAPELDRSAMKYRARRQAGGARQDMLSWFEDPTDDGARPRNRLSGALAIENYQRQQPASESLFVEAARRTALVGASIERMSDAYRINTKFGAVEIAEATLVGSTGSRNCLVFRHVADGVAMQFHGWFCSAPQRPMDRSTLACLIDRVDLIGGSDAAVRSWFAQAERARRACGSYPPIAAPAGWVDANGRMPDLKTAITDARKM